MVSDFARKHGITLIETDLMRARWVAHLLAFRQAVENTGATKALTFHSRVKAAEEFASDTPHGIGRYLKGYDVRHVHGKQRSSERKAHIDAFRHAEKGVLTNARCLTEGVDVPAVDMVVFLDPKQSRIDIAQATGRAMRKPQGASTKTVGYVVVPLFAADFEQSIWMRRSSPKRSTKSRMSSMPYKSTMRTCSTLFVSCESGKALANPLTSHDCARRWKSLVLRLIWSA